MQWCLQFMEIPWNSFYAFVCRPRCWLKNVFSDSSICKLLLDPLAKWQPWASGTHALCIRTVSACLPRPHGLSALTLLLSSWGSPAVAVPGNLADSLPMGADLIWFHSIDWSSIPWPAVAMIYLLHPCSQSFCTWHVDCCCGFFFNCCCYRP